MSCNDGLDLSFFLKSDPFAHLSFKIRQKRLSKRQIGALVFSLIAWEYGVDLFTPHASLYMCGMGLGTIFLAGVLP